MSPTPSAPTGCDRLTEAGPRLLGLDLGTSRIKALLVDRDGREGGLTAVPTPFHHGEMTVDHLLGALRDVADALGDKAGQVVAVGVTGIAESGAPLDREGRALAPIVAWHDPRGEEVVERLQRSFGPELERAIGQRLRTVSSVAKLGWLVDHGVGPVARWLGVPELVLFALTGVQLTEFSLVARTGAYDVATRRYLPGVVAALHVAEDVFPAVSGAGQVMGRVSPAAAAWSGLPAGIPVTVAGHDHLVGRVGSGAGADQWANSVGTAETVMAGAARLPDRDRARCLRVAVTVMPGGAEWGVLTSAARAGLVVVAAAAALGRPVDELDRLARGRGAVAVGDELIAAAARGEAVDLPAGAPGEVWNGVLGALAARTWEAVDRVAQVIASAPPRGLVVFGGGSRSQPWLEAKAAARPATPVWRTGSSEAAARGAALYAGVAAGWWPGVGTAPHAPPARVVIG